MLYLILRPITKTNSNRMIDDDYICPITDSETLMI